MTGDTKWMVYWAPIHKLNLFNFFSFNTLVLWLLTWGGLEDKKTGHMKAVKYGRTIIKCKERIQLKYKYFAGAGHWVVTMMELGEPPQ